MDKPEGLMAINGLQFNPLLKGLATTSHCSVGF